MYVWLTENTWPKYVIINKLWLTDIIEWKTIRLTKRELCSVRDTLFFVVIKCFSFTKMLKNAHLIFMTIIKLFIAVCFNNNGGSSLKMAIKPLQVEQGY